MKDVHTYTGTLASVQRMRNTTKGNARYAAELIPHGHAPRVSFVTKPDSMTAGYVDMYRGQRVIVSIGTHRGRSTLKDIYLEKETA